MPGGSAASEVHSEGPRAGWAEDASGSNNITKRNSQLVEAEEETIICFHPFPKKRRKNTNVNILVAWNFFQPDLVGDVVELLFADGFELFTARLEFFV